MLFDPGPAADADATREGRFLSASLAALLSISMEPLKVRAVIDHDLCRGQIPDHRTVLPDGEPDKERVGAERLKSPDRIMRNSLGWIERPVRFLNLPTAQRR